MQEFRRLKRLSISLLVSLSIVLVFSSGCGKKQESGMDGDDAVLVNAVEVSSYDATMTENDEQSTEMNAEIIDKEEFDSTVDQSVDDDVVVDDLDVTSDVLDENVDESSVFDESVGEGSEDLDLQDDIDGAVEFVDSDSNAEPDHDDTVSE